ncbi:GNAT family N-acetyltransferase [Streptomyces indicus]|uniref:GNAT family N-acetyltransferase n=1 Tax=Streptomyces indicus TaxID=417292 RepID=UPI001C40B417|nr:GNAT family N-acetyltransferase [Streptomyces indicus]
MAVVSGEAVVIEGDGLVLREWRDEDLPAMVKIFDNEDVARFTPLPTPFGHAEAEAHLAAAREKRAAGTHLRLAVTTDGELPLGEVMVNLNLCALGYAIGPEHRGQGLAVRATRLLTSYAHEVLGVRELRLQIDEDNTGSRAVATACGYRLVEDEAEWIESKGRRVLLTSWLHEAPGASV